MFQNRNQSIRFLILTIFCTVFVASCAQIRKVTYPDEFVYLESGDIQTRMHQMAGHLAEIEFLLSTADASSDKTLHNSIVAQLDTMTRLARELGAESIGTNHLLLDAHMDRFLADVLLAREGAVLDPPNYYQVGKLTGSCGACHEFH